MTTEFNNTGATAPHTDSATMSSPVVDERSTGQKIRDLFAAKNAKKEGSTPDTTTHDATTANTDGTTTTTTPGRSGDKVGKAVGGIGGVIAAIHGAGEKLRGEFNAGFDKAFDPKPGVDKRNVNIAEKGDRAIERGVEGNPKMAQEPEQPQEEGVVVGEEAKEGGKM